MRQTVIKIVSKPIMKTISTKFFSQKRQVYFPIFLNFITNNSTIKKVSNFQGKGQGKKKMKNPSSLLPLEFGNLLTIRKIVWQDFKNEPDQTMPWSAHIYWNIDYKIIDIQKKRVTSKLYITKKSWVRQQRKCQHLLNHQQGHYLIGALCALQFLRRVDNKRLTSKKKFQDLVSQTFDRTMKQHLQMQKKYDNETQHRLNYKRQQEWDELIFDKLEYYMKIYDRKKNRFVKLSQSKEKKK